MSFESSMTPVENFSLFIRGYLHPIYVMGINVYASELVKNFLIAGFVDDETSLDRYMDIPIIKIDELPSDAYVIIASGGRPLTAKKKLDERQIFSIDYFTLVRHSELSLTPIVFNEKSIESYKKNRDKFKKISGILEDSLSRNIYEKLVNFRVSHDLNHLSGFANNVKEQYFDDCLNIMEGEGQVFCDIGGYDGITTLEFIRRYPRYKSVHIFEPDPNNYLQCNNLFNANERISLHQCALADFNGTLSFQSSGSTSKPAKKGSIEVKAIRLDDCKMAENASFLKIDIEGGEKAALRGAKELILRNHPIIAVAIYHSFDDFFEIPNLVMSIRSDYKIYIRHYTESIYETICFFIPVKVL